MIALRRVDVAELNERARAAMRAAGRLGPDELDTPRATLAAGDRVVAERNDRRLGLTNGTLATVERVDKDRRTVTLRTDDGRTIEPTSTYVTEGHLAPAYALTAHKAQGMTVDRAFVLGSEELYREWGYTALSRHREEARFYVTAPADQPALPGLEPPEDAVAEELDRALGRSRAKEMATNVLARAGPRMEDRRSTASGPERLARQAADRARLVELLARPEPPAVPIDPPDYDTGLEL